MSKGSEAACSDEEAEQDQCGWKGEGGRARRASGKTTHILRLYIFQGLERLGHIFPKVTVKETNTKQGSKMIIDEEYETGGGTEKA